MALPKQTINILDPGLGLVASSTSMPLVIGGSSSGDLNKIYSFSSLNDVKATLGSGNLPQAVAKTLRESGGPVLAIRVDTSIAATIGTVLKTGSGPDVTVTGTPALKCFAKIEITKNGALGVGQFRFTLDDFVPGTLDPTWSSVRTIPAGGSFTIPNSGMTATFAAGSYVKGTTYEFLTSPAGVNATDVAGAFEELAKFPTIKPKLISVVSAQETQSAGFGLAAAVGGHLADMAGSFKYARAFVDVGSEDSTNNILTGAASFFDKRISTCYGYEATSSVMPIEGMATVMMPSVFSILPRAARELVSTDLARYASGNLGGVRHIFFDSTTNETLDDAGITTLCTREGGFYIGNGRLKAPPGSDFQFVQYGRIMDLACSTVRSAMMIAVAEGFRTVAGGAIDPRDASDINLIVNRALSAALLEPSNARGTAGHVSAASFAIDLTNNIASTGVLKTKTAVRPMGYARDIVQEIGFTL
jgi:hypothetical protein